MQPMAEIRVETAGADGWERVKRIDEHAFGYTWQESGSEPHRAILEMDRTVIATADGVDAGIASTYSLQMSVPGGGRIPVAGLTWVGVLPTHRRRGVLTAMMRDHVDGLNDTGGEAVAALFAAEPDDLRTVRLRPRVNPVEGHDPARVRPPATTGSRRGPARRPSRARSGSPPARPGQRCSCHSASGGTCAWTPVVGPSAERPRRPSAAAARRCAASSSTTRTARVPTRSTG